MSSRPECVKCGERITMGGCKCGEPTFSNAKAIEKLKAKARRIHGRFNSSLPYSCGRALTAHISGSEANQKDIQEMNETLDALCALDPSAPKTRYYLDEHGRVQTN